MTANGRNIGLRSSDSGNRSPILAQAAVLLAFEPLIAGQMSAITANEAARRCGRRRLWDGAECRNLTMTYRARPVGARELKRQQQLIARDSNTRFPVAEIVIGGQ
jgi:hypothetical protein